MKTYFIICATFVFIIFGCSKSDNDENSNENDPDQNTGIDADYVALLSKNGSLKPQLLNANAVVITLDPSESSLSEMPMPELSFTNDSYIIQYRKDGNCNGLITKHNFESDEKVDIAVFSDLDDCDLTATAIAQFETSIFISYELKNTSPSSYMVRIIDTSGSEMSFVDVALEQKPVDLAFANNRLFILTLDELITDENSLMVLNLSTNTLINEMGLGYSVRRIFTNAQNNIIISYDELHTVMNSTTLAFENILYKDNTEPKFAQSSSSYFDLEGRLFYPRESGVESAYPLVPAIYDFSKNLVIIYAYENFLTEAKRNFEYEIETTTSVGYDEENGLMLIGYKKVSDAAKAGGILRIKLAPEPMVIDNIDLDGVPTEIFVN